MTHQPQLARLAWWKRVRFHVRGLIVLVLLIGGGLGWVVRSAHVQRGAVAAIQRSGGSVLYNWEIEDGEEIANGKPWAPKWLVDLIGIDHFGHVADVDLGGCGSDADLVHVRQLSQLETLSLLDSSVTDAGLAR